MLQEEPTLLGPFLLRGSRRNGEPLSLPVLARANWVRRKEVFVRPIGYFLTPVEDGNVDSDAVEGIVRAAQSPTIAEFSWSVPPWCSWELPRARSRTWGGALTLSSARTFLITLDESVDSYLANKVSATHLRHLRVSKTRGLEVQLNPAPHLVDEYYALYSRVSEERSWTGKKLSAAFFRGVATELGDCGRLVMMLHGGRVVGGGVLLVDRHAVHYFQGAFDRHQKQVYPASVLYALALQEAGKRGLRYVNLGGVNEGNEGLIRFKESWGARSTTVSVINWRSGRRVIQKRIGDWLSAGKPRVARGP